MKRGKLFLILCVVFLLFLSACAKAQCKKNSDCTAKSNNAFASKCVDKKCVYSALPNKCGNELCESSENSCVCPSDCGNCSGSVPNSKYLVKSCVQKVCVEDAVSKPFSSSSEQTGAGDRFKIDVVYSQPFNVRKDVFGVNILLFQRSSQNREHKIISFELSGVTMDDRTVTLARQDSGKQILAVGSSANEELILDFITPEIEGKLKNLVLTVNYEYVVLQSGRKIMKQAFFKNQFSDKFVFVKPSTMPPCPLSCDDNNPATRDFCGFQTNNFCRHEPLANVCGNFKCDSGETKCSCAIDCGSCSGSAGNFIEFYCGEAVCLTKLKPDLVVQPVSVFDERALGPVKLNNNYKFSNPFVVGKNKFKIVFALYRREEGVSNITINTIRLLEAQKQFAELVVNKQFADNLEVEIPIADIVEPEEERYLTLAVWYSFTQGGKEKTGKFEKPLDKITFVSSK